MENHLRISQKVWLFLGVLLASLAMAGIVSAVEGACVQLAWQCDGPNGATTYTACGVDICTACPPNSLAYRTKCAGQPGQNSNTQTSLANGLAITAGDLGLLAQNVLREIMGQPLLLKGGGVGTEIPTTGERITALVSVTVILAFFGFIIKAIVKKVLMARKNRARPSYLQPKKRRTPIVTNPNERRFKK
jgi:hypothetical protein